MTVQISPYAITLLLATLISIVLAVAALQYRDRARWLSIWFALLNLTGGFWTLCYALDIATPDTNLPLKLLFSKARFLGIVYIPMAWMLFAALFTRQGHWITARRVLYLSIMPTITFLLLATTEAHHLMWSSYALSYVGDASVISSVPGPWFWVHSVYSYLMMSGGAIYFARAFIRSPKSYGRHIIPMSIAVLAPWGANVISVFAVTSVDYTPFAFTITCIALAWSVFRLRLLSVIPIARDNVMENIQDGVIVLDTRGTILDLNPAAQNLINAERQSSIGLPVQQFWPSLYNAMGNAQHELTLTAKGTRYLEVTISPLQSRVDQTVGRIVILHDVTEARVKEQQIRAQNEALIRANEALTIARQQAEEATRLKSEFLATMSHELRTPLNAVIGYTQLQLEGIAGDLPAEVRTYQQKVLNNAQHLLALINEVLDLAKIEAGRMTLQATTFSLSDLFEQIVNHTKVLADKKALPFESTYDPRLPATLHGDPTRLKQIAVNLLSNAVKFTDEGRVTFAMKALPNREFSIVVTDTGIGIPEDQHDVVFQEFRQVDGSSTRAHGGTGLGLAIVKRLVEMMNGRIELKSKIGEGSTFTVVLPVVEEVTGEVRLPVPDIASAKSS